MKQLEKQFSECVKKKKKLEQEISVGNKKGVLKADIEEDIETLEYKQDKLKEEYSSLEEKALYLSISMERARFAELNDLEKELFGILLSKIGQEDLEKMRHNRWEEFPLDMRNRIVELLDGLCDKEQWKPIGAGIGMEINVGLIEYKLLHPREYRLFSVAKMMMSDLISQETKDNVLKKMDKNIFNAYKELSKAIDGNVKDKDKNKDENKAVPEDMARNMDEGINECLVRMKEKNI